jgi:hypothetical protein
LSIDVAKDLRARFLPRFLASKAESFFSKVFALLPKTPSIETTNGEKSRRCPRQASRYFFFFSHSWACSDKIEKKERMTVTKQNVR